MGTIGTATIKVLPDLAEFNEIVAAIPSAGLTLTEDTTFEYDEVGRVARQVTTRTVSKAL